MTITANSYFSGAGLMDLGLRRAGIEIHQTVELDPACCETQKLNFGREIAPCDIATKLAENEPACDVKVFTWPCNRYAAISALHGMRTGDELYLHGLRHMVIKPPEVFVAENVPGMRKFPVVMEVLTRLPDYYVTVFCPVGAQTWLPQRRDRLIVIGSRRRFNWRQPRARRCIRLSEVLEGDPRVEVPDYVFKRLRGGYRDRPIISDPAAGDIAPTCVAHYAKDLSTRLVRDARFRRGVRPYTVREYARLQGVPDDFAFPGTASEAYRQIGNGVAVPMAEWIGREIGRYFGR